MFSWYVVQTKPQREKDVVSLLSKGGFDTFLPLVNEKIYKKRAPFLRPAPLFPSYIFVHIDFEQKDCFNLVKYTRGVNKIICYGNQPISISSDVIYTIKNRTNGEGVIVPYQSFKQGDRIRVKKGLLKDLIGILEKPVDANGRLKVLLQLLNYQVHVTLHWSEIERMKVA